MPNDHIRLGITSVYVLACHIKTLIVHLPSHQRFTFFQSLKLYTSEMLRQVSRYMEYPISKVSTIYLIRRVVCSHTECLALGNGGPPMETMIGKMTMRRKAQYTMEKVLISCSKKKSDSCVIQEVPVEIKI